MKVFRASKHDSKNIFKAKEKKMPEREREKSVLRIAYHAADVFRKSEDLTVDCHSSIRHEINKHFDLIIPQRFPFSRREISQKRHYISNVISQPYPLTDFRELCPCFNLFAINQIKRLSIRSLLR